MLFPEVHPALERAGDFEAAWRDLAFDIGAREQVIGQSVEGRAIRAFHLGDGPVVLLTALMHGLEVVGSLALMKSVRALALARMPVRLSIVPIVNPDAYADNAARAFAGRRAWRRCNMNGVDLNRNFPAMGTNTLWHPFAGSRFKLSPHYAGAHALSEPETQALAALVTAAPPFVALGFHSFGNMLLYPWAMSREMHPRSARYRKLCGAFNDAVPTPYRARQASHFYPTLGDLDDWLDGCFGTLALTIEVGMLDKSLFAPNRLTNPFAWMNPGDLERAASMIVPGVTALISAATAHRHAHVLPS